MKKPVCYSCKSKEDLRPVGGQSSSYICKPCHNARVAGYYNAKKILVFEHYGAVCVCCGENTLEFLSIDHVDNDGNKERHPNGGRVSGKHLYPKIVKSGFPDSYQVLCMNCNFGKHANNGVCPHKILDTKLGHSV